MAAVLELYRLNARCCLRRRLRRRRHKTLSSSPSSIATPSAFGRCRTSSVSCERLTMVFPVARGHVVRRHNKMYLHTGWEEFGHAHNLQAGYVLTFVYE